MYQNVSDYPAINLNSLKPIGYDRKDMQEYYLRTIDSLRPLKFLLDKVYHVAIVTNLPPSINAELNGTILEFIGVINELEQENIKSQTINDFYNSKSALLARINNMFIPTRLEANPTNKFLFLCNSVLSFKIENVEKEATDLLKAKFEFESFFNESKKDNSSITNQIKEIETRANGVLQEIQDKASKTLISKYAEVFKEEANTYRLIANNWLYFGICTCILLIVLLLLVIENIWLNTTEKIISSEKIYYIYDYSKLISKFLLISIFLFLISYCFKKYSVYKHLQTINRHRQNALNSYGLLTESIIGDDPMTRNSLMLQVAKAIYEQTNTGFLPVTANESQGSEILEITKILGKTNT